MVAALLDTNILIDHLAGIPQAEAEIRRYTRRAISIITWMEVLVGTDRNHTIATRAFLRSFEVLDVDDPVAERAIELRRNHRIKLPDAIIWATAQTHALLFVTRNTKDFPTHDPGVWAPYILQ